MFSLMEMNKFVCGKQQVQKDTVSLESNVLLITLYA